MGDPLVTPDILKQNQIKVMQLISLPHLLPILRSTPELFSQEELDRVADEHHSIIERTGYLLQFVQKKGQRGIDKFLHCIREEKESPGHREILDLLEGPPPDIPPRAPILDILDEKLDEIASQINMTTFLSAMTTTGTISVNTYMDVSNPQRTPQENLMRLLRAIEKSGTAGFISFVQCFQQADAPPAHEHLAKMLLEEVQKFLQQNPRREELSSGDKIELLQLVTRARSGPVELELESKLKQHEAKLLEGITLPALLPYLQKHHVISRAEAERLNSMDPSNRTKELLQIISSKGPKALPKFVDCLSESPEHKELGRLFSPQTTRPPTKKPQAAGEKYGRVAVLVCMDEYVDLDDDYRPNKKEISEYNPDFKQHRKRLKECLRRVGFHIVDFGPLLAEKEEEGGLSSDISTKIMECFQEHTKEPGARTHDAYSAGILLQGRSEVSRRPPECIRTQDLRHWVEFLPTSYITFLIDTHPSHVAAFGKQKQPTEVEIMPDPWKALTTVHTHVVLYFVRPDEKALWRQRGKEASKKPVFGLLTEKFAEALTSWIRRKEPEVSHRLFYEGISFHWHEKGKVHLLYNPTFQGDVDRVFLGKSSCPYHQVFRTDLPQRSTSDPSERFNLKELQVATGTMAGLIGGDELEIFHVLRPEVRVSGRVAKAYQLSSIAEVTEKDRERFHQVLGDIYEHVETSKDGSTEFVFAEKKFPLHMRERTMQLCSWRASGKVMLKPSAHTPRIPLFCCPLQTSMKVTCMDTVFELGATLDSDLDFYYQVRLTTAPRAKIVVKCEGEFFVVEDVTRDVVWKARVKSAQHVKSMLEMLAWYKYVKGLKPQQKTPLLHSCFLTAEKQLLSRAIPLSAEFQLKWSSSETPTDRPQDAILQFSDPKPLFWVPSYMDHRPWIEVEFRDNHVITAIEIRGDAQEDTFVKRAVIMHQKLVRTEQDLYEGPATAQASKTIDLHCQEAVRFVTIVPETWSGASFNLTVKMKHSVVGGKGVSLKDIDAMTVVNWPYHQQQDTPWRFVPPPDAAGVISLTSAYHWLSWSGSTRDPLTFDLGGPSILEKLEITAITELNRLQRFRLQLRTSWFQHNLPETPTVWPMKHEIDPRPLVVSNVRVFPLETNAPSLQGNVRMQLQLYGNKQGELLSVEEGGLLTFHFTNYSQHQVFVYLFCLEETGMVKFVHFEVVQKMGSYKKFLRTTIPEDYNPLTKQITDLYKVFVSPKKMYLEPFLQRGLHEYHCACNYSICSIGRRPDIGKDEQWYQYEFRVAVKKSSRR